MSDVPDFRAITVERLAGMVRGREVTARAVTEAALDRIEALDPALHAFVALDADAALRRAEEIDATIDAGAEPGPLAGVPIGVKDVEDAAGFVTSHGAAHLAQGPVAGRDSYLVERLRGAGCVVVGKTNTPESAWTGDTYNPVFGATLSPWGTGRSPGGSSGGTAAAVAAGMIPLGTGTDGGGSIRIPSGVTGMSGHKPSQGRVPGGPASMGTLDLSTAGPMARRIRDVAMALDVVAGPAPGDLRSLDPPRSSYRGALDQPRPPRRVLWAPQLTAVAPDREIADVCRAAVDRIEAAGVEVTETGPIPHAFGAFLALFFGGMLARYRDLLDDERWEQVTPGLRDMLLGSIDRVTSDSLIEARKAAQAMSIGLAERMTGHDALLSPLTAGQTPVSRRQGLIDGEESEKWAGYTWPFNMTRRPAATTCAGFTADGMPVGLQVVGHQTDDAGTLATTAWIEDLLGLDPVAPFPP